MSDESPLRRAVELVRKASPRPAPIGCAAIPVHELAEQLARHGRRLYDLTGVDVVRHLLERTVPINAAAHAAVLTSQTCMLAGESASSVGVLSMLNGALSYQTDRVIVMRATLYDAESPGYDPGPATYTTRIADHRAASPRYDAACVVASTLAATLSVWATKLCRAHGCDVVRALFTYRAPLPYHAFAELARSADMFVMPVSPPGLSAADLLAGLFMSAGLAAGDGDPAIVVARLPGPIPGPPPVSLDCCGRPAETGTPAAIVFEAIRASEYSYRPPGEPPVEDLTVLNRDGVNTPDDVAALLQSIAPPAVAAAAPGLVAATAASVITDEAWALLRKQVGPLVLLAFKVILDRVPAPPDPVPNVIPQAAWDAAMHAFGEAIVILIQGAFAS